MHKDHVSHHSAEVRCQLGDVAFQAALGAPCVAAASLGQVQLGRNFLGDSESQNGRGRGCLGVSGKTSGKTGKHTQTHTHQQKHTHTYIYIYIIIYTQHIHDAFFGRAFDKHFSMDLGGEPPGWLIFLGATHHLAPWGIGSTWMVKDMQWKSNVLVWIVHWPWMWWSWAWVMYQLDRHFVRVLFQDVCGVFANSLLHSQSRLIVPHP